MNRRYDWLDMCMACTVTALASELLTLAFVLN